jgi:hypothetical protein
MEHFFDFVLCKCIDDRNDNSSAGCALTHACSLSFGNIQHSRDKEREEKGLFGDFFE